MATAQLIREAESFYDALENNIGKKAEVADIRYGPYTGSAAYVGTIDSYGRRRAPTNHDLLRELKNTAWTCASINAATCADSPPKLYVRTAPMQPQPKCRVGPPLRREELKQLLPQHPVVQNNVNVTVQEVHEHPILEMFKNVNPVHNAFDLWELTQFYLEINGKSFWLLDTNVFGAPSQIWILPSHEVWPWREHGSPNIIDYYEHRNKDGKVERYDPSRIIYFKLPNPRDPYIDGMGPLQSSYEQVTLNSDYTAMRHSIYDNTGIPSLIISPDETIGEDEAGRLETKWNQKFRKGGMGKALVAESKMGVQLLNHSMGDLAALAEAKATKEDIANAFCVPMPYLSGDTNLANMEAAEIFHKRLAIKPRLTRRDEKLNEQLIPLFDPTGRLFLASEDPTPENKKELREQQDADLRSGVRSINEVRQARGLPPVEWGQMPYPTQVQDASVQTQGQV